MCERRLIGHKEFDSWFGVAVVNRMARRRDVSVSLRSKEKPVAQKTPTHTLLDKTCTCEISIEWKASASRHIASAGVASTDGAFSKQLKALGPAAGEIAISMLPSDEVQVTTPRPAEEFSQVRRHRAMGLPGFVSTSIACHIAIDNRILSDASFCLHPAPGETRHGV